MDNKEQARVKAEAKHTALGYNQHSRICAHANAYKVYNEGGLCYDFPFADLKDGDLCVVKQAGDIVSSFYYNGEWYEGVKNGVFLAMCMGPSTLIAKTGFNILEHLEGEK